MGPSVILDKSALEALSVDESVWLEALLNANVVPVFYVEVLADLEKRARHGQTPEDAVARLAEKTPGNAYPNVHHRTMVQGELDGDPIEMAGWPVISGGDMRRAKDGRLGVHLEEFPEQAALLRWQHHEFEEMERGIAKQWRDELAAQDLGALVDRARTILPEDRKISDLQQLKDFIDEFCERTDRRTIPLLANLLGLSPERTRALRRRWERELRRPLDRFVPYTVHVFKVDLLFYLGVARGFISAERPSNLVDFAYLYYLPFAAAFISGDGLHARTAPLLLGEDQSFLTTAELKAALGELDAYYETLPAQIKERGVLAFAAYPPSTLDNAVTQLWDARMRPDWREAATRYEAALATEPDVEAGRQVVRELEAELEGAEPVDDEATLAPDGPDYGVRQRFVPATKGRWRMVPADLETGADPETGSGS